MINRLPTKLLSWKIPHELLFHKEPNYNSLKVFGCLCFVTNVKPHKDKLASRANAVVFLGFKSGMKAFKVYDLLAKKIVMTRDVVFHETHFPFLNSIFPDDYNLPSLPLTTDLKSDYSSDTNIYDITATPS